MGRWIMNVLIGLDQWANAILGGAPDETISARTGRARRAGKLWGRVLGGALDWIDPGHVEDAIRHEEERSHLGPDYHRKGSE